MVVRRITYNPRKTVDRRLKFYILIAVVAVLLVVGLILLLTMQVNLKDTIKQVPFNAQNSVLTADEGTVYTDGDNLILLGYDTKLIWQKKIFASNVKITSSENLVAVYNDKMVQLFDLNGNQLFSKEIAGTIDNVDCGKDKIAVVNEVQTEEAGKKTSLLVLDIKGNQIDNVDDFSNQNILDAGFYGKNSKLWVLTLDSTGVIPISRIATYDPGRTITGSIDINGQLVDKLLIDENNIYASGTTNLAIYNLFGEKKDSVLIYGWNFHGQYTIENKPVFLYVPRNKTNGNGFDSLRIITTENEDLTINLPPDILKACIFNNKLYCFSKNYLYKYSIEGKLENKYELPYSIDGVFKIYQNHAFLIKGSDVFALPLP